MAIAPLAVKAGVKALPWVGQIASNLFGMFTARGQQKKANRFNVDMWKRQNMYNSPAEQMRRLREAGLNPNLIYGQSSAGATGNNSGAPTFEGLADSGYRPVDIPSTIESLQSFTDWDIKTATADNLRSKTETEKQNAVLKTVETAGRLLQNNKLAKELPFVEELAKSSLDAARANVKKIEADTTFTLNQDERNAIMQDQNIMESLERIYSMRTGRKLTEEQIKNAGLDSFVKQLDAKATEQGWRPSDPWYARALGRIWDLIQKSPSLSKKQRDQLKQPNFPRK